MANWPKAGTALAISARPLSTLTPSRGGQRHDPEQPVGVRALRRAGHLRVRLGVEFKAARAVAAATLGFGEDPGLLAGVAPARSYARRPGA